MIIYNLGKVLRNGEKKTLKNIKCKKKKPKKTQPIRRRKKIYIFIYKKFKHPKFPN